MVVGVRASAANILHQIDDMKNGTCVHRCTNCCRIEQSYTINDVRAFVEMVYVAV